MLPAFGERPTNALRRHRQLLKDEPRLKPQHPIAEPSELSIAARIGGPPLKVARPIDFDHEVGPRSEEIRRFGRRKLTGCKRIRFEQRSLTQPGSSFTLARSITRASRGAGAPSAEQR